VVTTANEAAVLKLSGELDLAMAPSVRSRLADVDGDIELDCSGLTFMDSAGINLFVEIHHASVDRGAKLTVVNAPRCVTRLLALTGVDRLIDVRPGGAFA
jgi:anti-anti-sigma factor